MSREIVNHNLEGFYLELKVHQSITEEIVEMKLADTEDRNGYYSHNFMNSWYGNLPPYGYRFVNFQYELFDGKEDIRTYGEKFVGPNYARNNSDLFLSKTERQFFEDVKNAIEECGLDMNSLEDAYRTCENIDKINEYTLPVYFKLRKMGYSIHDLIA